jgi:hypothetical protein
MLVFHLQRKKNRVNEFFKKTRDFFAPRQNTQFFRKSNLFNCLVPKLETDIVMMINAANYLYLEPFLTRKVEFPEKLALLKMVISWQGGKIFRPA